MDSNKCAACEHLIELYVQTPQTPRDYWVTTELFVMLHGGDVCNKGVAVEADAAKERASGNPQPAG